MQIVYWYIWSCLVALINLYSKLIGWVIEGRKYVAAGDDLTFLVVVFFLVEINGWHTIFSFRTVQVSGFFYLAVVL